MPVGVVNGDALGLGPALGMRCAALGMHVVLLVLEREPCVLSSLQKVPAEPRVSG